MLRTLQFCGRPRGNIRIGENVGISQSALIAQGADIVIEANVKIGGGSSFYTTDFHSLDARVRASGQDLAQRVCRPIRICEGAFIGAHAIILKGVTVGEGSIVGAGSVVTKSIPAGAKRVEVTSPEFETVPSGYVARVSSQTVTYGGIEDD